MMRCRLVLLPVLWVAAVLPVLAGPQHYSITVEQVAASLTRSGVQVSTDQIALLTNVYAKVAGPSLQVKSIERADDHSLVARIECVEAEQCLPFMVALHIDRASAGMLATAQLSTPHPVAASRPPAILVRAGSPATLLLDGGHVHISINVICLGNGAMGQTIRAANPDRSQFYTVQVVGDRLLKGSL